MASWLRRLRARDVGGSSDGGFAAVSEAREQAGGERSSWVFGLAFAFVLLVLAVWVDWKWPGVSRFPVRGIDVSHHQGEIDWNAVASARVRFAFIKSSEGRDHRDTRFQENWAEADRVGLARGAYHFFTFCSPGAAQARHFLEVVPPRKGTLPPAVDVEFAGNCRSWTSIEDIRRELRIFLAAIEKAWGRQPLLYLTSESDSRIVSGHFDDHPVWIRNVFWRPGRREPAWLFWQFSDDGRLPGIDTPVDLNVYRGGLDELAVLSQRPAQRPAQRTQRTGGVPSEGAPTKP